MYDKTIAGEQRIYNINITSTPTLVYDLLLGANRADFDYIWQTGIVVNNVGGIFKNPKVTIRTPIDGYVVSSSGIIYVRHSASSDAETVSASTQYTIPVNFWPFKTWVSAGSTIPATVRIFFS